MNKSAPDSLMRRLQFLYIVSLNYRFDQIIIEPTRVTRTSATLIDLAITNKKQNIVKSGVLHLGLSDHSLIFVVRKHFVITSLQNVKYARNFKKFIETDFLNDLSQILWDNVTFYNDPNISYQL